MNLLNIKKMMMLLLVALTFFACDDELYDNTAPAPPANVVTVTGDERVDIQWDHNREGDISGYNVYYNTSYQGQYELIGSTSDNYFIDAGSNGPSNGSVNYYAIAAYDYNGNESELSYDMAIGIPRPEGFNQAIFDYLNFPQNSGYNFKSYIVVPYNTDDADFFFENDNGVFYLNVWQDSDIQDMGTTQDIYDIAQAPQDGWVPLIQGDNVKYIQVAAGHTYVVWTWDNHFAKVRIKTVTNERVVFDWAYQLIEGETLLKRNQTIRNLGTQEVIK